MIYELTHMCHFRVDHFCTLAAARHHMPPNCAVYVEVWGPCTWKFLHAIAATAPVDDGPDGVAPYVDILETIGHVLPCAKCRAHYNEYVRHHPIGPFLADPKNRAPPLANMQGNIALQKWVHNAHNDVNRRSGKSEMSFEQSYKAVHSACLRDLRPGHLADPYYGTFAPTLTAKQRDRLHGIEHASSAVTGSFKNSNLVFIAALVLLVAISGLTILKRRNLAKTTGAVRAPPDAHTVQATGLAGTWLGWHRMF